MNETEGVQPQPCCGKVLVQGALVRGQQLDFFAPHTAVHFFQFTKAPNFAAQLAAHLCASCISDGHYSWSGYGFSAMDEKRNDVAQLRMFRQSASITAFTTGAPAATRASANTSS